jgi:hypothetical protein
LTGTICGLKYPKKTHRCSGGINALTNRQFTSEMVP